MATLIKQFDTFTIWETLLTDEEVRALSRGVHPMFIRPSKIVYLERGRSCQN